MEKVERQTVVRGRDIETGLPKSIRVSEAEIRETLSTVIHEIIEALSETIEETPPELIGDIMEHGIHLAGGGSKLAGLDKMIAEQVKIPVVQSKDPETAVVRGAGKVLKDANLLNKVKVTGGLQ